METLSGGVSLSAPAFLLFKGPSKTLQKRTKADIGLRKRGIVCIFVGSKIVASDLVTWSHQVTSAPSLPPVLLDQNTPPQHH